MTPLRLAQTECSNYIEETCGCQGINIKDDGSLAKFPAPKKCLLHTKTERCAFFEQAVLPLVNSWRPPYKGDNTIERHKEGKEALKLYCMSRGCVIPIIKGNREDSEADSGSDHSGEADATS